MGNQEGSLNKSLVPKSVQEAEWLTRNLTLSPNQLAYEEKKREFGLKIIELQKMIETFEIDHSLENLSSITSVSPSLYSLLLNDKEISVEEVEHALAEINEEEIKKYKTRAKAEKDFQFIFKKFSVLKKNDIFGFNTEIEELEEEIILIHNAIGFFNFNEKNTIIHKKVSNHQGSFDDFDDDEGL